MLWPMPFAPLLALQLLLGCRDEASPPLGEGCDEACAPLQSWDFPPSVDPYHQAFDVVDRRLVARSRDFLHVFDASVTPPVLQGSVEVGFGTDVALAGERAYATTDYGVVVVDLSDPSAPVELGELFWVSDGSSFEAVVVAEGDTAWVLEPFTGSLWGVDATDPSDPVLLAELEVDAFDLHLSDDVLWCVGADGVQGLDVGVTPPVELGRFAAPGDIDRFGVAGDVLLASYWIPGGKTVDNGFVRWDLRDAAAPSLIDDIAADKPGCGQGRLVMDTDRAFLACPELHTFDLATGAYEPSALLDAVDVTLPLELLRDGERVHGMPVGSGLVEGAPWVSWSMDGSDVEAAELRPDALGGSVLGMVAAGQRLFVRVSGRTLVLDVDPVAGPAVADQWDVDVRHGHDGVVVTDEGLLDTLGEPVPAVLPAAVDGVELVGGGATLAGMRDLTLVVVGFTADGRWRRWWRRSSSTWTGPASWTACSAGRRWRLWERAMWSRPCGCRASWTGPTAPKSARCGWTWSPARRGRWTGSGTRWGRRTCTAATGRTWWLSTLAPRRRSVGSRAMRRAR